MSIELSVSPTGGLVLNDGTPFHLKGAVWGGAELRADRAPSGLDVHAAEWYATFLHQNGFNAVKLLISLDGVTANPRIAHNAGDEEHIAAEHTLLGLSYIEMVLMLATTLHNHGVLVFVAALEEDALATAMVLHGGSAMVLRRDTSERDEEEL